ncbi:hypothetical protein JTB14_007199 [Gonioctena quinquepunctata]|nr:hypothetical protein JTB14_007199 [Gonioctena quinquepunctata]
MLNKIVSKTNTKNEDTTAKEKKQHISETCREEEQDYDKILKSTPSRSNRTTVTTMEPGLSSASSKDYLKKQQSKLVEEYENKMQDIINLQTEGSKRLESAKTNQSENNYKNADRTPKTTYYNGREERKSRYTRKYGPVYGTDESNSIKTVNKQTYIFATGFEVDTSISDIMNILKKVDKNVPFTCEILSLSNSHTVSSYKIGVPFYLHKQILRANVWPRGVLVNYFLDKITN